MNYVGNSSYDRQMLEPLHSLYNSPHLTEYPGRLATYCRMSQGLNKNDTQMQQKLIWFMCNAGSLEEVETILCG